MTSTRTPFVKASERIRLELEQAIQDGNLLPGDAIDEAELAGRYAVSRTPVREALIKLQAQGMVSALPRGGMIVAKMDLQQLMSLWELLAQLEGVAVRLACERMTPQERRALVTHLEESRAVVESDDIAGWQESNLQFHDLIYRATRNPYLRQEVLRMRARIGFYRRHAFAAVGQIKTSFDQHRRVVEALRAGDAEAAQRAMLEHMSPAPDAKGLTDFIVNLPKNSLD